MDSANTTNSENLIKVKIANLNLLNYLLNKNENSNCKIYEGSDIQKTLENFPGFIWSKYSKEKHLPGHSYTGPGTRLDIRLI